MNYVDELKAQYYNMCQTKEKVASELEATKASVKVLTTQLEIITAGCENLQTTINELSATGVKLAESVSEPEVVGEVKKVEDVSKPTLSKEFSLSDIGQDICFTCNIDWDDLNSEEKIKKVMRDYLYQKPESKINDLSFAKLTENLVKKSGLTNKEIIDRLYTLIK